MKRFILLCCLALCTAFTPPTKFEVKALPGWVDSQNQSKPLPSRVFTGFLNGGVPPSGKGSMYFHYWMVESERNPAKDPVIFWYNGGPGASSLFGMLQEFGPLVLTDDSYDAAYEKTGIPTPIFNPSRWTRTHTVVAIDSPPPMGMSFCSEEGPAGGPTSCGPWKDSTVFAANHAAHRYFFEAVFPELKSNPFFFAGESYAGIYVPGFVDAMLKDPVEGLNFQGFMVGDGWTGCQPVAGKPADWCVNLDNVGVFKYPNVYPGPYYDVQFFFGHSQFSNELHTEIISTCSEAELRGTKPMAPACSALIDEMAEEVGYFYAYNLYNECPIGEMSPKPTNQVSKHGMNKALAARRHFYTKLTGKKGDAWSGLSSPCLGQAMPEWLLLPETLTALGAPANTKFINLDNGHGFNYTSDATFIGHVYQAAYKAGLRILVYEGDNDACGLQTSPVEDIFVPLFTEEMGLNRTQRWRPFTNDGAQQMGGYSIVWENGDVRFVSLRGSGHLAPLNRPQAAFTLVDCFTSGRPLPPYVKP